MDFSDALDAVRYDGFEVTREGWDDSMIVLSPASGKSAPYLVYKDESGVSVPWQPSQLDLLADDWSIV